MILKLKSQSHVPWVLVTSSAAELVLKYGSKEFDSTFTG